MTDSDVAKELAMEAVLLGEATDAQLELLGLTREEAEAEYRARVEANEEADE